MLYVLVEMKVKESARSAFLDCCREVQPLVTAEDGCYGYEYTLATESPSAKDQILDPNVITLVERWESAEKLAAHSASAHMKSFSEKVSGMRESVKITVHETIF